MAEFKDKLGRSWVLDLTVADLKAVRQATGVEFTAAGCKELYDQIAKLAGDFNLMGRAVWAVIEDQAKAKGIPYGDSPDSFEKGLNAPTIKASALALIDAFVDFYHPPAVAAAMKEAVRGVLEKEEAAAGLTIAAAIRAANPALLSGSAGSMPGSPGSTPAA